METKKSVSLKVVVLLLAAVLVIGGAVGGTLAWLVANSGTVTNTFVVGDINIELKEHALVNGEPTGREITVNEEKAYKVLPGTSQKKDPFVRVLAESEACWLFVQVKEVNNTVTGKDYKYVTYSVDTSVWTALDGNSGVYYKKLENVTTDDTEYNIISGKTVSYADTLTKADVEAIENNQPQLVFKAFAVQVEAADNATAAWALAEGKLS